MRSIFSLGKEDSMVKDNANDAGDKVQDTLQGLDNSLGSSLQSAEQLAYGGSSPVNLGFAPIEIMDGDKSCAS
jgi:hypothetical protein